LDGKGRVDKTRLDQAVFNKHKKVKERGRKDGRVRLIAK
jgi:hypothetical protein